MVHSYRLQANGAGWIPLLYCWCAGHTSVMMSSRISLRRRNAATILVLGLGVATSVVSFAVVYSLAFRGPSLPAAEEVFVVAPSTSGSSVGFSLAEVESIEAGLNAMGIASAYYYKRGVNLQGDGYASRLVSAPVSGDFFRVLGVAPQHGRVIGPDDDRHGAARIVVISDSLWRSEFAADRAIIGRFIDLDGEAHEVVGVLPRTFAVPDDEVGAWTAIEPTFGPVLRAAELRVVRLIGRLGPGTAMSEVRAAVTVLLTNHRSPAEPSAREINVVPLARWGSMHIWAGLTVLMLCSAALLGIACLSAFSLQLSGFHEQRRGMVIRSVVGARTIDLLLRQARSGAGIALAAGVLGGVLALWALAAVRALGAAAVPELANVVVDRYVVLFAMALVVGSLGIVHVVPGIGLSRVEPSTILREGAQTITGGRAGWRFAGVLLGASVAVAVTFLVGAIGLGASLAALLRTDVGYDPAGVYRASIRLPYQVATPNDRDRIAVLADEIREAAAQTPEFEDVSIAAVGPGQWYLVTTDISVPDRSALPITAGMVQVSPNYFRTLGIDVQRGRDFTQFDRRGSPLVVVVDTRTARGLFGDQDPVGQRIRFDAWNDEAEVVGVVSNARVAGRSGPAQPQVYVPFAQHALPHIVLIARSRSAAGDGEEIIRGLMAGVDPSLPVADVRHLDEVVHEEVRRPRFYAILIGLFAGLAGTLTCIGLCAIVDAVVVGRRRDVAIMLALGATPFVVVRRLIRYVVVACTVGVAVGWPLSGIVMALLRSQFHGIGPVGSATYLQAAMIVWSAMWVAAFIPAYRAVSMTPAESLRM